MKFFPFLIVLIAFAIIIILYTSRPMDKKTQEIQKTFAELEQNQSLMKATFAGVCFWCMEGPFQEQEGVSEVISGYTGGNTEDPSYEEVVAGTTGHKESVRVYFDPNKIFYERLLEIYWLQIDPTDDEGQFADRGEQYRTAIYYHSDEQKLIAEKAKKELDESGKYVSPIVVQILPVQTFYPAEDYHQDFYLHSSERYKQYEKGSGRSAFKELNKKLFGK